MHETRPDPVLATEQRLRHAANLRGDRRHGRLQRGILAAMLLHHPNRTLAELGRKPARLVHGSILSRVGASTIPGAVQIDHDAKRLS